ncbi:HEXXH motif domain-containing protein [Nonomuraea sp. NPDC050783]|uniref:HEXXH motif domain-containing protein n=1 Tax=Nonomuraea sp. NPDC050783 TaxID=3154634 RepID=UPI0034652A9B
MTPRPLAVPSRVITDLSHGRGTSEACDLLLRAQHSKHLLLLGLVLEEAVRRRHPQAAATRDAYDLITAVERAAPDAAARVVRYPAVGAWAVRTLWHLRRGDPPERCGGAQPRRMAALAAGAALLGEVELAVDLPAGSGVIHLPGVGRLTLPRARTARLRIRPGGGVEARGRSAQVSRVWPLDAPPGVLLDDLDPFRFPPGARLARRLTPGRLAGWTGPLTAGWNLLLAHHLAVAAEVGRLVSVLVPLAPAGRRMRSASSRACFGGIALSRPPGALDAALTLAHEVQHVKLSALIDLFPLVAPDTGERYYAPWRADPRPLRGLLHGTYAFMGVAAFWERQRHLDPRPSAHVQFARWREAAAETVPVLLGSGRLTELGRTFVAGMGDRLAELAKESVPPHAVTLARRAALRHRTRWLREHAGG